MNTESATHSDPASANTAGPADRAPQRGGPPSAFSIPTFGLEKWEIAVLAVSFLMIAGIAMPNYFGALEELRGKECSRRLLLVANSLQYLAEQNETKPGEKICDPLELNRALDLAQGALSVKGDFTYVPAFFRYGTEPDCTDNGNHIYDFYLGADGKIVPPKCSMTDGPKGEYFLSKNLHMTDMSKVDGKIEPKTEGGE